MRREITFVGLLFGILSINACAHRDIEQPSASSPSPVLPQEITGVAKRVALSEDAILGQGYSLVADTLRGHAIQTEPKFIQDSTENAISYNLKLVESYEELKEALGIDVKASLKYLGGKYKASFSLYESTKMINERAYVVMQMTVLVGRVQSQVFISVTL